MAYNLSMDVKENITNILHAVGVRFENGLSDKDIRKALNLKNPGALLTAVQRAVGRQLQNDRTSARNVLGKQVAYDFNAVLQLLTQTTNLSQDAGTALLNTMCQDDYGVTDIILHGMVEGLPEQEGMTPEVAEQSATALNDIMQANYQTYLKSNKLTAQQLSFEDFQTLRAKQNITGMLASLIGDTQQAEAFLAQPIDEHNPIFTSNKALQEKFLAAKEQRTKGGADKVQVMDVLMMFSQSVTKAQVLAFYENRVVEQNQVGEHGERLSDKSPTKIDNALGSAGRKATEEAVGQRLTNKLTPQTKVVEGKPLPEHKWRGYQRLASLIKSTVQAMYSTIQSGWFVQKLTERAKPQGKKFAPASEVTQWDTQYQAMPEDYQNQPAGEFFTFVQARMLDDKVKVSALSTQLQNELAQSGYTLEDVIEYSKTGETDKKIAANSQAEQLAKDAEAAEAAAAVEVDRHDLFAISQSNAARKKAAEARAAADAQPMVDLTPLDHCAQLYDQISYLQNRITAAEDNLADLQEKAANNPDAMQDSGLLENVNHNIVCLKTNIKPEEAPEVYQARCKENAKLLTKNSVVNFVNQEQNLSAQNYLQSSLAQFLQSNNSQNDLEKAASFEMLADLFGVRDKFDQGTVTVEELQDLLKDVKTGPFNPVKANAMIKGLQDGSLSPEKCRQVLHDSAVTFLQDKYQEAHTNYDLSKTAAEEIKNM